MPPAEGAGGSPDDAMAAIEEEQRARMEAVASAAPQPSEAYDVKLIEKLVAELNKLAEKAVGEGAVPEIQFDAGGEKKWAQPLPGNVFVPLVAVNEMAAQLEFDKYTFDPMELDSNAGLRSASGKIRQMHSDADFIEAVTAPPEGEEMEGPELTEAPAEELAPGDMTAEDEELMAAM